MSVSTRSRGVALFVSLRPAQWTKNFILFAGLIFGGKLLDPASVLVAGLAFVVFCALSGVVYLVNDVHDADADRLHPSKSRRPVAAGDVSPRTAILTAIILTGVALAVAFWLDPLFFAVSFTYVALLTGYSVSLKHHAVIDVLTIAAGFVLRAVAGAVVIMSRSATGCWC